MKQSAGGDGRFGVACATHQTCVGPCSGTLGAGHPHGASGLHGLVCDGGGDCRLLSDGSSGWSVEVIMYGKDSLI